MDGRFRAQEGGASTAQLEADGVQEDRPEEEMEMSSVII
jgi:hypothetical protein